MPINERLKVLAAAAGEPKRKRARPRDVDVAGRGGEVASGSAGVEEGHSSGPTTPRVRPESVASAAGVVLVEDTDTLDCGVCFLPLKPPIFQCDVGHVVCSPCHDRLKATGKCHVCGCTTGGYQRCHAMEHMVESVRVLCPNAAYGCYAKPAYYDQQGHHHICPHGPCSCLGKDCGFVGSTEALLNHFTSVHGWPCPTKIRADSLMMCRICLYDGFNFVLADHTTDDEEGATASSQYLFLVNVERLPLGRVISVHCIHPQITSKSTVPKCTLKYTQIQCNPHNKLLGSQSVQSEFYVDFTDVSNGLPDPDDCFQFLVPDSLTDNKENAIQVEACIDIYHIHPSPL